MRTILTPALLLAVLFISACAKHPGDVEGAVPSSAIEIFSPVANMVSQKGDSLSIVANAISANTIHGYDLRISKRNDTTDLFFYHGHLHNDTIMINKKWANTVNGPADLVLSVLIYLDHNGNTNEKKVAFKVQ